MEVTEFKQEMYEFKQETKQEFAELKKWVYKGFASQTRKIITAMIASMGLMTTITGFIVHYISA